MRLRLGVRTLVVFGLLAALVAGGYLLVREPIRRFDARLENARSMEVTPDLRDAFFAMVDREELQRRTLQPSTFLAPAPTLRRRIAQRALSAILEARYDEDEILIIYLDGIYMGRQGSRDIIGIREASRVYYRKDVGKLTLSEAVTLAAMHVSPNRIRDPERARERRDKLLGRMLHLGMIDRAEYEQARRARN